MGRQLCPQHIHDLISESNIQIVNSNSEYSLSILYCIEHKFE